MKYIEEFLLPKKDIIPGSAMYRLRQCIINERKSLLSASTSSSVQSLTSSAGLSSASQHKAGSADRSTASACKDSLKPNLDPSKVRKRFQPNEGSSSIQIFKTILVPEKTSQETSSSKISSQPDQACTLGQAAVSVDVPTEAVLVDLKATTPSVSVVSSSGTKPSTTKKQSARTKPSWNCSEAQKEWMMGEMNELGLYPGTANYNVSQC